MDSTDNSTPASPMPAVPDLRGAGGPAREIRADDAAVEPDVILDLDTLEREQAAKPFYFRHNERRYLLIDPQEMDWQDLIVAIGDMYAFFRKAVPVDDQPEFFTTKMASWKMKALMERYQQHYGLPDPKALAG